jgi:hypothetical protein
MAEQLQLPSEKFVDSPFYSVYSFEKWAERCKKYTVGTLQKRPSPHLHKIPTLSNKTSPRTFQTALVVAPLS